MRDLWQRMEEYLRAHARAVLPPLRPPATDADIARAEQALGAPLPPELVESLKVHDGQRQETGHGPPAIPLVPAEHDRRSASIASWGELAPLDLIVTSTLQSRRGLA